MSKRSRAVVEHEEKELALREALTAWRAGDEELFSYFVLQQNVDPTPFLWKISPQYGNCRKLKFLLDLGANPNVQSTGGMSLLKYYAQVSANVDCVRFLLQAGARDNSALKGVVRTAASSLYLEGESEPLYTNARAIVIMLRSVTDDAGIELARQELQSPEWAEVQSNPKTIQLLEDLV